MQPEPQQHERAGQGIPLRALWACLALLAALAAAGCQQSMAVQPRYDPLEPSAFFPDGQSARPRLPGTVARGELVTDPMLSTGQAGGQVASTIPISLTTEVMLRGRERYDIYCAPCHGLTGAGDGMVVQRGFPAPPTLHDERLRSAPPGYLFGVITNGFGRMFPYGSMIAPEDRWAIVGYIRALQLSQNAPAESLPDEDRQKLPGGSQ